jgi:hypothetical protein
MFGTSERCNGLSGCVSCGECVSEEPLFVASEEGPSCTELVSLFVCLLGSGPVSLLLVWLYFWLPNCIIFRLLAASLVGALQSFLS